MYDLFSENNTAPKPMTVPVELAVQWLKLSAHAGPQLVMVTPELAAELLKLNVENRTLRQTNIDKIARDMTQGRWEDNGDTIRFSDEPALLDGQHRLLAIIKTGLPMPLWIRSGLAKKTRSTMDTGARRTAGDALKFAGVSNGKNVAAVIRKVLMWNMGDKKLSSNLTISNAEIEDAFQSDALAFQRSADIGTRTYGGFVFLPASVIGTAHYLTYKIDSATCGEFFDRLGSGLMLTADSPVYALRKKAEIDKKNKVEVPDGVKLSMIFLAWNKVRKGEPLTAIRLKSPTTGEVIYHEPK